MSDAQLLGRGERVKTYHHGATLARYASACMVKGGGTPDEKWTPAENLATCGIPTSNTTSVLWNGMVAPFINMTIFGALWSDLPHARYAFWEVILPASVFLGNGSVCQRSPLCHQKMIVWHPMATNSTK